MEIILSLCQIWLGILQWCKSVLNMPRPIGRHRGCFCFFVQVVFVSLFPAGSCNMFVTAFLTWGHWTMGRKHLQCLSWIVVELYWPPDRAEIATEANVEDKRTWNTCGIGRAPTLMDRVFLDVLKVLFWRLQPDFKCGKGIVSKRLKTLETGMPPLIFGGKEWSYNTLHYQNEGSFLCAICFISEYIYIYTYPLRVCTWCYDSRGSLQSNHCSRSNLSFAKTY